MVARCLLKILPPVLGPGKGPGCGAGLGPTPQPPGVPGRSGVRERLQPMSNCPRWSLSVCGSGDRAGGRPDLWQERGVPEAAWSWRGRLKGAGHGRVCLHSLLLKTACRTWRSQEERPASPPSPMSPDIPMFPSPSARQPSLRLMIWGPCPVPCPGGRWQGTSGVAQGHVWLGATVSSPWGLKRSWGRGEAMSLRSG